MQGSTGLGQSYFNGAAPIHQKAEKKKWASPETKLYHL